MRQFKNELEMLHSWSRNERPYQDNACVHELFAAAASRSPDVCALRFEGSTVTYGALNERANQLAHLLAGYGVTNSTRVAISIQRSVDLPLALLAVLKAGGVYVPVDPTYPAAYNRQILARSKVSLILSDNAAIGQLVEGQTLLMRDVIEASFRCPKTEPLVVQKPSDAACVLFTSGTTGHPKGVLITHRGIVRLVDQDCFARMGPSEVWLQFAPISFDASLLEIWGCLLNGSCLAIPSPRIRSVHELGTFILDEQVTTTWLTAGLFHLVVEEQLGSLRDIRQILTGGDVVSAPHVKRFLQACPGARVVNGYGPTENTTFSTYHVISSEGQIGETVPIGKPIANTEAFVLDSHLQVCSVGAVGEIYVGGDGLALGYLDEPELTAERFIPHPFGAANERLYRTGDRGRWSSNGEIEFVGRTDDQTKIRGFRIELKEVEMVLARAPEVRNVAVVAHSRIPAPSVTGDLCRDANKELVAYVVANRKTINQEEQTQLTIAISQFLRARVPQQMIPSAYVFMTTLPLTSNGKVDRAALQPPPKPCGLSEDDRADQTQTKSALTKICKDILHLSQVDTEVGFLDLGGHSLTAMQVAARMRALHGVDLSIQLLLQNATITAAANQIELSYTDPNAVTPLHPTFCVEGNILRTTSAQQRFWFLNELYGQNCTYNVAIAIKLGGLLNIPALQQSLNDVVESHEALRTRYPLRFGRPVQEVTPASNIEMIQLTLALPEVECEEVAIQHLTEFSRRGFDLAREVPLRVMLIAVNEYTHFLGIVSHHIALDGSVNILLRELANGYNVANARILTPPRLDRARYRLLVEQIEQRSLREFPKQSAYWRNRLRDIAVLNLPTDRPRKAVCSYRGAIYKFSFTEALSSQLLDFSKAETVTPFMLALSGLFALLHRYTGQTDLAIGTPILVDNGAAVEDVIGCFVNTIVIRTEMCGDQTFRTLLHQVRDAALGAYHHREMPFDRLVDLLGVVRESSRHPLFQVMFAMTYADEVNLNGIATKAIQLDLGRSRFDLLISLEISAGEINGIVEYATDLYDESTIARLASSFETLLWDALRHTDRCINELQVLSPSDYKSVVSDWNATDALYAQEACVHELFEAEARHSPNLIAAVDEDKRSLLYGELNSEANRIAHLLTDIGIHVGEAVGVLLGRSFHILSAFFGILKAGAAFVPIDPQLPYSRILMMASIAKIRIVITERSQTSLMRQLCGEYDVLRHVVYLDELVVDGLGLREGITLWGRNDIDGRSIFDRVGSASSADLAYIMFTSGSSGTPKGVMVQHRAIINLLEWMKRKEHLTSADRVLFVTSIGFDLSIFDIFGLLTVGGSIRIASTDERRDPSRLMKILCEEPITIWNSTPALLQQLQREFEEYPSSFTRGRPLRLVLLSGDWLPLKLPETVRLAFPHAKIVNLGGATEATVWSNYFDVGDVSSDWISIPYGRPISNARYYVLGPKMEPCPIGVFGELYIGGDCLALGYADDKARTAEKFVSDPFAAGGGYRARLYRTGDIARFWGDGTIELAGRNDSQIKLRGYRIELGEIESALSDHPAVQTAVVTVQGRSPHAHLRAYLTINHDVGEPTRFDLQNFVRHHLPDYMIPNTYVVLDRLPTTLNGKIDRDGLPLAGGRELGSGKAPTFEEAGRSRSALDQTVLTIWKAVLGVANIELDANFFDLGGNSLLLIEVHHELRKTVAPDIPLAELFAYPTVDSLASRLADLQPQHGTQYAATAVHWSSDECKNEIVSNRARLGRLSHNRVDRNVNLPASIDERADGHYDKS